MDSPWITFAPADAHRDYHALLSYLPLNKYSAVSGFFRFSFQIQKQLRSTPGIVGYAPPRQHFAPQLLDAFRLGGSKSTHGICGENSAGEAMRAMTPHMGSSKFTHWKEVGSSLPLTWNEALQRLQPGVPT